MKNINEMTKRRFHNLFQPISFGSLNLPNRIFFASMGLGMANSNGGFSQDLLNFYSDIMDGGCNLSFLANASVSPSSRLGKGGLCLYNEEQADSLIPIFNLANTKNCIVGVQLQHYGGQGSVINDFPLLTPSGTSCKKYSNQNQSHNIKAMDQNEINEVINQFANSAELAMNAGAKLIQLQASNGYLLSSFLSPYTNSRNDIYGGSEENRARLLLEVIAAISKRTKDQLTITVRLGIDDRLGKDGLQPHLLIKTVRLLEQAGIGAIECSMCINETFKDFLKYSKEMDEYLCSGVKLIKSKTSLPVGFAGFVDSLDKAERLITEGVADFIGMTRALFADNELISKTLAGKDNLIDRCLWDGNCFKDKSNPNFGRVYCCVNPKYLRPSTN